MQFETLSLSHVNRLLDFELKNRAWFESVISPREEYFYSGAGVLAHVNEMMKDMEYGTGFNAVITKQDVIIARANLKHIKDGEAEVGYRVCSEYTGQGVGSFCLSVLIDNAIELNINKLTAYVLGNNGASRRVLEKQGFSEVEIIEQYMTLNNELLDCWVLQKCV